MIFMLLFTVLQLLFWVFLFCIVPIIFVFNSIVKYENQAKNAFSTIDVMLQKRYDLIPNLVETVKGYMQHERNIIEDITRMRTEAMMNRASDVVQANDKITDRMNRLYVAAENYPDLKADRLFLQLSRDLRYMENELSAGRRAYNASVTDFNNAIMTFPRNIVAKLMKKTKMELFQTSLDIRQIDRFTVNL